MQPQSSSLPLCLSTKAARESRDRDSSNSAVLTPALKRSKVGYPLTEWREQSSRSSVQSTGNGAGRDGRRGNADGGM